MLLCFFRNWTDLTGDGCLLLPGGGLDTLLGDERLEYSSVGVLRIAKVQELVEKLVDQDKVVFHVLLADFAKVGLHHFAHLQQELEHHGRVHILLRHLDQSILKTNKSEL